MIIIDIDKQGQNSTTIFNVLDNNTELWMTKYHIGEIFSSGRATLYKHPSDQTVYYLYRFGLYFGLLGRKFRSRLGGNKTSIFTLEKITDNATKVVWFEK